MIIKIIPKVVNNNYLLKLPSDSLNELDSEKIDHGDMEISFMIETPAAVLLAPAIAKEGSMMIIGTSSLAEYASAPCPPDKTFQIPFPGCLC